jgi:hypothetical protein
MSVCCKCCELSGGGLCDEFITRPEESYRLWCLTACLCDLVHEEALAHWGLLRQKRIEVVCGNVTKSLLGLNNWN